MQFVNKGIILVVATANLKYTFLKFTGLTHSPYNDFTQDWYEQIGYTIIMAMTY